MPVWAVRLAGLFSEPDCDSGRMKPSPLARVWMQFRKKLLHQSQFIRGISCGRPCGYCTHWQRKLQLILKLIQYRRWHSPKSLSLLHPGFYHLTAFGSNLTFPLWWGLLHMLASWCWLPGQLGSLVQERVLAQLNLEWKSCPKCSLLLPVLKARSFWSQLSRSQWMLFVLGCLNK